MESTELFIEETLPGEAGYRVIWRGTEFPEALDNLKSIQSQNRLELWSKAHAGSPKGFAPMAFREAGSSHIMIGNTLKMLMHPPMESLAERIVDKLLDEYYHPEMEPDEPDEPGTRCPACGGEGQFLGKLGHLAHFRCRRCGYDFSEDGYQPFSNDTTPPKANIMPGGDTAAIGIPGGGN